VKSRCPTAAPTRTAAEAAVLDDVDRRVRAIALALGGRDMQYPSLIARPILERAEYPQAFPHLLMSASRTHLPDGAESGTRVNRQRRTAWCLSPAVCYHTYAELAEVCLDRPAIVTARGTCFRAESTTAPGVRQIEFSMREIVFAGAAAWVERSLESARLQVDALARGLGLAGEWRVAEDPFFLPRVNAKAVMQRLLKVKLEYQAIADGGLALASVNRHGAFFGNRFAITTADGDPVHTACLAVGLDRWAQHPRTASIAGEVTRCER
jgi:hypothetical protein